MPKSDQFVIPPEDFILASAETPSTEVVLPTNCRGLLVGTAGSLNVTMKNGEERDSVPFVQGVTPGFFGRIRSGGTAENIWAIV